MSEKTELTMYIDNLPKEARNISVIMTNSRTLKEHSGGGRIHGSSLVISDIEKEQGDSHYFEVAVLDGGGKVLDKVYINTILPQKKNVMAVSLVSGIWLLDREIGMGGRTYDRIVIEPLEDKKAADVHGTHLFYLSNSKNGDKTGAGAFRYHVTDSESSLYGVQEVKTMPDSGTVVVCNENYSNLDLTEGVIMDATLQNTLSAGRKSPYTVGKSGNRVEFELWMTQSSPGSANTVLTASIGEFGEKLKSLSPLLAQHPAPKIGDLQHIALSDLPVVQFRKQCVGQYKVFPYRYSSVTFIAARYDIAIQKTRAVKVI